MKQNVPGQEHTLARRMFDGEIKRLNDTYWFIKETSTTISTLLIEPSTSSKTKALLLSSLGKKIEVEE